MSPLSPSPSPVPYLSSRTEVSTKKKKKNSHTYKHQIQDNRILLAETQMLEQSNRCNAFIGGGHISTIDKANYFHGSETITASPQLSPLLIVKKILSVMFYLWDFPKDVSNPHTLKHTMRTPISSWLSQRVAKQQRL